MYLESPVSIKSIKSPGIGVFSIRSLLNNTQSINCYKTIQVFYIFYLVNFKSPPPDLYYFIQVFKHIVISPQIPLTLLYISVTSVDMPYFYFFVWVFFYFLD